MLHRAAGILAAEVDSELVLMSTDGGVYYGLDAIGTLIWQQLETPASLAAIQANCSSRYQGDAAQMDADIVRLMQQMVDEKLLQINQD